MCDRTRKHLKMLFVNSMQLIFLISVTLFSQLEKGSANTGTHVKVIVKVLTNDTINLIDERYLSVALDSGLIQKKWETFDPSSSKLQTLAAALAPCYLRVGGTMADFLTFDPGPGPDMGNSNQDIESDARVIDGGSVVLSKDFKNFTMYGSDWTMINQFAMKVGWRLLFDFNVLKRSGTSWDSSNAELLLKYSIDKQLSTNLDFELGNEPNSFKHSVNRSLSAAQLGRDFLTLKNIVHNTTLYGDHYKNSLLVGPDVTRAKKSSIKYLKEYMEVVKTAVDKVTFHQYYVNGRTATVDDFTDPSVLDLLLQQITEYGTVLQELGYGKLPMWLGETASAWDGGAPDLSNAYVAGFMWLDKLGISAKMNVDVVVRQTFYSGHYALVDHELEPYPDYWLSLLYKRLVGRQVFETTVSRDSGKIRMYAHCTATSRSGYGAGAVTIYGLNLCDNDVYLNFTGLAGSSLDVYLLTPTEDNDLQSRYISLNGEKLEMVDDHTLPKLLPRRYATTKLVKFPSLTFSFYVFPDAKIQACMN